MPPSTSNAGNNDEFVASLLPEAVGTFDYVYRYTTTDGRDWLYADLNGPIPAGALPPNPGKLTVNLERRHDAARRPDRPARGLGLAGRHRAGLGCGGRRPDPLRLRGAAQRHSGRPVHDVRARHRAPATPIPHVAEGATYYYVVRSVDTSFNRSGNSAEVTATAELRTVTLIFNVTVPATTDATGRSVYIAGFLDRLDGGLPQWNPGGVVLTRVDATHWTITLTGKETTQIEYKYTLGDLGSCREGRHLRRDRQPPAHAELRQHRHADRQRYGAELAQRGALRQLIQLTDRITNTPREPCCSRGVFV